MLKLRSTLHEVAWKVISLACNSGPMFGRVFLQLHLGYYSVRIGHQSEQNYNKIFLKHIFKITLSHFAQYLMKAAVKSCTQKNRSCEKLYYNIPGTCLNHHHTT